MKEFVKEFIVKNEFPRNEHGVCIFVSKDRSTSLDLEAILEIFGHELRNKIHKTIK